MRYAKNSGPRGCSYGYILTDKELIALKFSIDKSRERDEEPKVQTRGQKLKQADGEKKWLVEFQAIPWDHYWEESWKKDYHDKKRSIHPDAKLTVCLALWWLHWMALFGGDPTSGPVPSEKPGKMTLLLQDVRSTSSPVQSGNKPPSQSSRQQPAQGSSESSSTTAASTKRPAKKKNVVGSPSGNKGQSQFLSKGKAHVGALVRARKGDLERSSGLGNLYSCFSSCLYS